MPLFYLLWRSINGSSSTAGGVWALIIGSVVALVQFFLGNMVESGGFGPSRWWSGFVDIVTLPVLAPLIVYFILVFFKMLPGTLGFASFAILWLIPGGALKAVSWSSLRDPILLVLVPVLWTSIAVGISFYIDVIINSHKLLIIPAALGILVIPFAATCSYWAFYSQKNSLGFLFGFVACAQMLVSVVLAFVKKSGTA
jgi:hypothetical protein